MLPLLPQFIPVVKGEGSSGLKAGAPIGGTSWSVGGWRRGEGGGGGGGC